MAFLEGGEARWELHSHRLPPYPTSITWKRFRVPYTHVWKQQPKFFAFRSLLVLFRVAARSMGAKRFDGQLDQIFEGREGIRNRYVGTRLALPSLRACVALLWIYYVIIFKLLVISPGCEHLPER